MPKKLIESDDSDVDDTLDFNQDYVNSYENFRAKEELQKLKDKYKDNVLSDDEIDSQSDVDDDNEEDDEESDDLDEEEQVFDEKFFKVYGALKRKDSAIYDKNYCVFNQVKEDDVDGDDEAVEDADDNQFKKKSSKSICLLDYHTKLLKEKQGVTDEDEVGFLKKDKGPSYYQELDAIKEEFKSILAEEENEGENEQLIKGLKVGPKKEKKLSTTEILKLGSQSDEDISFLKNYWNNKELDEKEKFLKDYIIKRRYLSQNVSSGSDEDEDKSEEDKLRSDKEDADDNDDDDDVDDGKCKSIQVAKHRFQEPDSAFIKRFPRSFNSVRETVTGSIRAVKRAEVRERKKKEKQEELQRYRELKRKEIREKLEKLEDVSHNQMLVEQVDVDLLVDETDFDPAKYDAKMKELFGDGYYNAKGDIKKPIFDVIPGVDDENEEIPGLEFLRDDDDSDDDRNNDNYFNVELEEEDTKQELNQDSNKIEEVEEEISFSKVKKKNKKNKKKEKASLLEKKNIGIYEDLVGDVPTRFKYRRVQSNDFGLTPGELLLSDDKDLNRWVSLKKTCQYRSKQEEDHDLKSYARKGSDYTLKKKILKSLYDESKLIAVRSEMDHGEPSSKKKRRRKTKNRMANQQPNLDSISQTKVKLETHPKLYPHQKIDEPKQSVNLNQSISSVRNNTDCRVEERHEKTKPSESNGKKKRKQRKKQRGTQVINFERLKAYGLSNREIKKAKLV